MTGKIYRNTLRWVHIAIAVVTGVFIYSPWGHESWFENLMAFVVFPLLVITGVLMWQQAAVMKGLRKGMDQ